MTIAPIFYRHASAVGVLLMSLSSGTLAQVAGENILIPLAEGYSVGYQKKSVGSSISEWVLLGESVESWTELVTTLVWFNPTWQTLSDYKAAADQSAVKGCPGYESLVVAEDRENGYSVLVWTGKCPINPSTNKVEWIMQKAIRGHDAIYNVQKAFKFEPSEAQRRQWTGFLRKVSVCDTRDPEHPCPPLTQMLLKPHGTTSETPASIEQ